MCLCYYSWLFLKKIIFENFILKQYIYNTSISLSPCSNFSHVPLNSLSNLWSHLFNYCYTYMCLCAYVWVSTAECIHYSAAHLHICLDTSPGFLTRIPGIRFRSSLCLQGKHCNCAITPFLHHTNEARKHRKTEGWWIPIKGQNGSSYLHLMLSRSSLSLHSLQE